MESKGTMSHFLLSISFPKNKVSAGQTDALSGSNRHHLSSGSLPPTAGDSLSNTGLSRKPLLPRPYFAYPTKSIPMPMSDNTAYNSEESLPETRRMRGIVRKSLGMTPESKLPTVNQGRHISDGATIAPGPSALPIGPSHKVEEVLKKGRESERRRLSTGMGPRKILYHIPGFSDDEDDEGEGDAKIRATRNKSGRSSSQIAGIPTEAEQHQYWGLRSTPYQPSFMVEREDREIELCNPLNPPPFHQRKKKAVIPRR